jgi:hypothetical protein
MTNLKFPINKPCIQASGKLDRDYIHSYIVNFTVGLGDCLIKACITARDERSTAVRLKTTSCGVELTTPSWERRETSPGAPNVIHYAVKSDCSI